MVNDVYRCYARISDINQTIIKRIYIHTEPLDVFQYGVIDDCNGFTFNITDRSVRAKAHDEEDCMTSVVQIS